MTPILLLLAIRFLFDVDGQKKRDATGKKTHGIPSHSAQSLSQTFFKASITVFGLNGMRLIRTPVALKNAFATAGAAGGTPTSPIPPIFSVLLIMWT